MLILGHRGTGVTMRNSKAQEDARRRAGVQGPENTIKAFELALKQGADGLELDVIRTADHDLAVIHDNDLGLHAKGARGKVAGSRMAELRKLDVGDGEGIPSLRDVFALAARYNYPLLNIELSGKDTYHLAYVQAKEAGYPLDRIVFSSFHHDELARLRRLDPQVKIGLLFQPRRQILGLPINTPGRKSFSENYTDSALQTIRPTSLHLDSAEVTPQLIAYARRRRLEIFLWTRGEKPPAQDGTILDLARQFRVKSNIHLITDYPGAVKEALRFC